MTTKTRRKHIYHFQLLISAITNRGEGDFRFQTQVNIKANSIEHFIAKLKVNYYFNAYKSYIGRDTTRTYCYQYDNLSVTKTNRNSRGNKVAKLDFMEIYK